MARKDPEPEAAPVVAEPTAEEKLAKAKADLNAAEAAFHAARLAHAQTEAESKQAEEDKAEHGVHALVDEVGNGDYVTRELPPEYKKNADGLFRGYPRHFISNGTSVEQVGETSKGVRKYRKM